jgi:hypothetical protein
MAAGLLASGCTPERPRDGPAPPVRFGPERAAIPEWPSGATPGRGDPAARAPAPRASEREPTGAEPATLASARERPSSDPIATNTTELEPGVNEDFDQDILLDIDDALAATNENAFATLLKQERVLVDGKLVKKEKSAHPDSCRRWRSLRARGYAPKSALGKQINAGALVRCGCLEFLARARPSRVSYVRNLLVGAGPSSLPAIVASATSPLAQEARNRAVARGSALAEFLPNSHSVASELPGRLAIAEPSSRSSVILNSEVWGDINSDGVEDVVLSVLNTSDDGTYFDLRLIQVTRSSVTAPVTVLAVTD